MMRSLLAAAVLLSATVVSAAPQSPTSAPIVFFDIAGADGPRLQKFYNELFAWTIAGDGTFAAPVTTPLSGVIRQDPAATLFYVGVEDINATLKRIAANGGTIVFPRLEVPGRVIIGMFKDPAGNQVGLVEMKDGKAKVP
jgi:uncharacterized protein